MQQQEQLQQQQQQVIIIQQQPAAVTRGKVLTYAIIPSFPRGLAVGLGIAQLLFGVISIFAASLAFVYLAYNYEIGFGYWCGMFFFVSAGVSMHAGKRPTRRMMKHLIAWSVISFIFAGVEFGLSIDGLNYNVNYPYYPNAYVCWWWYWWASFCTYNYPAMEAANGLMLTVSGLELLICVGLISVSARALKQWASGTLFWNVVLIRNNLFCIRYTAHPTHATNTDATVVELQSAQNGGHDRRHNNVTVTVVETSVQPQYLQQQNFAVNEFGPPPTYEVIAPPAYVK